MGYKGHNQGYIFMIKKNIFLLFNHQWNSKLNLKV